MREVSATEANRHFSKLLREAAAGETILVTSRGRPIATLGPVAGDALERKASRRLGLLAGWFPAMSREDFASANAEIDQLFSGEEP